MSRVWLTAPVAGVALSLASPALAQDVDLGAVVKVACAGIRDEKEERPLPLDRLAEAILFQVGAPPSRLIGDTPLSRDAYAQLVINAILSPPVALDQATRRAIRNYLLVLSQDIGPDSTVTPKARGIKVVSPFPADVGARDWVFQPANAVKLACMPAKAAPQTVAAILDESSAPPRLGLIRKIEDLGLTGNDRKKAESAAIGVKRERTREDNGSSKTSTTLTFDGTLGFRVTGDDAVTHAFAFADYSLSRNRTKPAAALGVGERADDKDTNGLALGVTSDDIALGSLPLSLSGSSSYILNFAKDSERGVGRILLTPGWMPTDLGICGLGGLRTVDLGAAEFRTQCVLQGELAYSHVFKVGRADFKKHGDFLSAGVVVGIDLAPPLLEKSGVVGSFRYRWLPTISGVAPDVERIEAALKYRWWIGAATAFDFGLTYKRGEEFKTYTDEDSLELSFGVIF
jgi:hypothetical protein